MSMIRVDYNNARLQAKKLYAAVSDCEIAIQRLQSVLSKVPYCWEGDAANVFIMAVQKRIREIQKIRDQAEQMAVLIRRVADEFEETERRMKEALAAARADSADAGAPKNVKGFRSGNGF